MRTKRAHQAGFTLIEAMVSLVVLSVGMIGIAALYAQGLGASRTAQYRTFAVNLVGDMADRIRANRLAQGAYAGAAANGACDPQNGGGVDCAPAQMAGHDLFVFNQQVTQQLPNGQWQIVFNPAALPPSYQVTITWTEVGQGQVQHQMLIQVPTT